VTSNLCAPTGSSEMKVEWTLLTVSICKSRCQAQTVSHTHVQESHLSQHSPGFMDFTDN
jgi:hypothetical protein